MKNLLNLCGDHKHRLSLKSVAFLTLFMLLAAFIAGCNKETPVAVDEQASKEREMAPAQELSDNVMESRIRRSDTLMSTQSVAGTPPGVYVWLTWPRQNNYNLDIDLTVTGTPSSSAHVFFWAHQFGFTGGPGGYIGLQIVGNTRKALFSIWDAIGCSAGCRPFSGEGSGMQCLRDYNWQVGRKYRLRVWAAGKDAGGNEWWVGAVYDYVAKKEVQLGTILVPKGRGWLSNSSVTWTEYAGYTSCSVPYTRAVWSNPYARNADGNGAPKQAQVAYGNSRCPYSDVDYHGGTTYSLQAGSNVRRDTSEGAYLWR